MPKLLSFKEYVDMAEASQSRRYWFHVKSKKLVQVTETWHDWGPVGRPSAFGLKDSEVEEFQTAMDRGRDIINGLADLMTRKGWVRCSVMRDEWAIRANTLAKGGATAKALSKGNKTPKRLYLDAGNVSMLLMDGEIDNFIKTGKIIKRTDIGATMARFR